MTDLFPIIHENDEFLVLHKPAGLVCHPTRGDGWSSLAGRIRLYLGENSTAHIINRLDRETSGLTLVAKTDESCRALRRLFEKRLVQKTYRAIVHGEFPIEPVHLEAAIGRDESSRVWVKDKVREDGSPSTTDFTRLAIMEKNGQVFSVVQAFPKTGRKHQIRIHLAHLGFPIVGDKIYGLNEEFYLRFINSELTPEDEAKLILPHQALHAEKLMFTWREVPQEFYAEPEPGMKSF